MTAEVAVANKAAIALAADSAVTVSAPGVHKVINGANKLFQLGQGLPVAFMFYGNATLGLAPIESLIKTFRPLAANQTVTDLADYAQAFWNFLETGVPEFTPDARRNDLLRLISSYLTGLAQLVESEIRQQQLDGGRKLPKTLAKEVVRRVHEQTKASTQLSGLTAGDVNTAISAVENEMRAEIRRTLDPYQVDDATVNRVERWIRLAPTKQPEVGGYTGIVIAGYAPNALYPSLHHYRVAGFVGDRLSLSRVHFSQIDELNSVGLFPFAQHEMVYAFMEGIDPDLERNVLSLFAGSVAVMQDQILNAVGPHLDAAQAAAITAALGPVPEQITDQLRQVIWKFKREAYATPVLNALGSLPKEHLAEAAESLVNLTSFRRRVSLDLETVGGDIDVAVISPGDGFVWIKRKHYFDGELNPGYFTRFR